MRVAAQSSNFVVPNNIDFNDPDWKVKYEREFEARFNIPHITDLFPDAVSYPSTFCLKMRYFTHKTLLIYLILMFIVFVVLN